MIWTSDQIRAEMKRGLKSFVLYRDFRHRDLKPFIAAQLDGDYSVAETAHEVIVYDNYKRRNVE